MMNICQWRIHRSMLIVVLVIVVAMFLGACKANTSSTDEHGLLPHLSIALDLPEQLSLETTAHFQISVKQGDVPIEADRVMFELWPEGQPEQRIEFAGLPQNEGLYIGEYRLLAEGVYVIRARVTYGSLEAMPAKRFAIGEEAVLRLAELEQQASNNQDGNGNHDSQHHH